MALTNTGKNSGGGFFLEEPSSDPIEELQSSDEPTHEGFLESVSSSSSSCQTRCIECFHSFINSYLKTHFDYNVCDECRDDKGRHRLITRTEAKKEFLLKDCDLDQREPILKFISKKNPHEFARGDMKLYLFPQVSDRGVLVHGSQDSIEDEKERRGIKRRQQKQKNFSKKMKDLRRSVRSSLYTKDFDKKHEHEFDQEVCIDEDQDLWEKKCKSCGQVIRFEKM